jgi:hypothetical protein
VATGLWWLAAALELNIRGGLGGGTYRQREWIARRLENRSFCHASRPGGVKVVKVVCHYSHESHKISSAYGVAFTLE